MLSASQRAHRVSHRIGVVIAIMIAVPAVICFGAALYNKLSQPDYVPYPPVSDRSKPLSQEDQVKFLNWSKYQTGLTLENMNSKIVEENASRAAYKESSAGMSFGFGAMLTIAAIAIYFLLRGIGWIIAGAFAE